MILFARDWAKKQQKSGRPATWADVNSAITKCKSKVRPNTTYQDWVEKTKPVLHEQSSWWMKNLEHKGLIFPLKKSTIFSFSSMLFLFFQFLSLFYFFFF